jgi:hypothetical protein
MEVLGQYLHDLDFKDPTLHPVPQEIFDSLTSVLLDSISTITIGCIGLVIIDQLAQIYPAPSHLFCGHGSWGVKFYH